MDTVPFDCTTAERAAVTKIVKRALKINPALDRLSTEMDLIATHANGCALDFDKLAGFDDFNLMHDIYGIARHIDRATGELTDFFSPRCSAPDVDTALAQQALEVQP